MWNAENLSPKQIREFLKSSEEILFAGCGRSEKYAWVEGMLAAQNYAELSKRERGVVRAYVEEVTGMLAQIGVSHLYSLRASARYRNQAAVFEATRPVAIGIDERRRPDPQGHPDFLRADTVHQADR